MASLLFIHGTGVRNDNYDKTLAVIPNDFLSYIGEQVFPERVRDVEIQSRQPFPQSHSAYWMNRLFWNKVEAFLQ